MRDLGPIQIAANEEMKRKKYDCGKLAKDLASLNVPAIAALHQPIDILWTCDGQICAGDLKTIEDFIVSYMDGRLYAQGNAMQSMACRFAFILIEGGPGLWMATSWVTRATRAGHGTSSTTRCSTCSCKAGLKIMGTKRCAAIRLRRQVRRVRQM